MHRTSFSIPVSRSDHQPRVPLIMTNIFRKTLLPRTFNPLFMNTSYLMLSVNMNNLVTINVERTIIYVHDQYLQSSYVLLLDIKKCFSYGKLLSLVYHKITLLIKINHKHMLGCANSQLIGFNLHSDYNVNSR